MTLEGLLAFRQGCSLTHMLTKNAIRAIRAATELSQDSFGDLIGVSRCRVSHVEKGDGTFRPNILINLLDNQELRAHMASLGILPEDLLRVE